MLLSNVFLKFNVASWIFVGVFIVSCIAQLVLAFLEKEKIRRKEKPLCLFSLGMFAVVTLPTYPFIYVGAFCGMVGDILVVIRDKKYFPIGATFFFAGHIFYILQIILYFFNGKLETPYLIILGVILIFFLVTLSLLIPKYVKKKVEQIGIPLYYSLLFTMLPLMIIATIKVGSYMFLGIIGISLFIISDILIVYTKYKKQFKRYDFYIMLTYLMAQTLVVLSLVLTSIEIL